jgi:hypothetical protein
MYLKNMAFLPDDLARTVNSAAATDEKGKTISLSREASEQFRAVFTEHLAKVGFNEKYEPTSEGKVLEALIDRFYMK